MLLLNSFRFITNGTENVYEEIVFVLKASSNIQVSYTLLHDYTLRWLLFDITYD